MTTRKTPAEEPAKKPVADAAATTAADDAAVAEPVDNATADEATTKSIGTEAADDTETAEDVYYVEVAVEKRGVQKINLRDNASADDDANIDHAVPIGTHLKAVEDLGEWTRLTHGLYIMSNFVKKL